MCRETLRLSDRGNGCRLSTTEVELGESLRDQVVKKDTSLGGRQGGVFTLSHVLCRRLAPVTARHMHAITAACADK